jgi:hypothetical protein
VPALLIAAAVEKLGAFLVSIPPAAAAAAAANLHRLGSRGRLGAAVNEVADGTIETFSTASRGGVFYGSEPRIVAKATRERDNLRAAPAFVLLHLAHLDVAVQVEFGSEF